MRSVYRLLAILNAGKAARRGPSSFARQRTRAAAHRQLARAMRRSKWLRP